MTPLTPTFCEACKRDIGGGELGWKNHEVSKTHKANLGLPPAPEVPSDDLEAEIARLREAFAESEKRRLVAEANADRFNPFVHRPFFTTPAELIGWLGEAHMLEIAEVEMAKDNRERMKQGRPGLHLDDPRFYKAQIAKLIDQTAQSMVAQQTSWVDNAPPEDLIRMRTMKVVNPKNGVMWQLPIDGTINNAAGSLADPFVIYQRKGHKVISPVRCLLRDCYRPAAVDEADVQTIGGYCTSLHQTVMEGSAENRGDGRRVTRIDRLARGA